MRKVRPGGVGVSDLPFLFRPRKIGSRRISVGCGPTNDCREALSDGQTWRAALDVTCAGRNVELELGFAPLFEAQR